MTDPTNDNATAALIDQIDREYNRKTNDLIARHADAITDLQAKLAEVEAERDSFRAVLIGAGYGRVDEEIASMGINLATQLGEAVMAATKELQSKLASREDDIATEEAENATLRSVIASLQAQVTEARAAGFNHGYVIACCNLVNLHGQAEVGFDILVELGVSRAEVKRMNLCEYDTAALKEIEKGRNGKVYGDGRKRPRLTPTLSDAAQEGDRV